MFDRLRSPVENVHQLLPVELSVEPGKVVGLVGPPGFGLTRLGWSLLAQPARHGPVVYLDVRGWVNPQAAWDSGISPDRLIVVRCADRLLWPKTAAALLEGIRAVYAEVPSGVQESVLRRLVALARSRRSSLLLRPLGGDLPRGVAYLYLRGRAVDWTGPDAGHGRLGNRRLQLDASGKGMSGIERLIEVEDDGADVVRVVSRLVASPSRRAAG
jgi:hypothetical protein